MTMKSLLTAALALSLLGGGTALAQPTRPDRDRPNPQDWRATPDPRPAYRPGGPRWSRGDRPPPQYRPNQYGVGDRGQRGLRKPPRGYRWYRYGDHNYF